MATAKSEERHIICEVHGKAAHRAQVQELLLQLVGPARAEAGCLYYNLYQRADQPDTYYIIDGWTSAQAIAEHAEHPNVTRVVEKLLPLLDVPLKVTTSKRVSDPD
jgi:quinol monooxygenase YgiN